MRLTHFSATSGVIETVEIGVIGQRDLSDLSDPKGLRDLREESDDDRDRLTTAQEARVVSPKPTRIPPAATTEPVSVKTATRAAEETIGNGIGETAETAEEIVVIAAADLNDPTLKIGLRDGTSLRSAPAVVELELEVVIGTARTVEIVGETEESARDLQHLHGGRSLHQT